MSISQSVEISRDRINMFLESLSSINVLSTDGFAYNLPQLADGETNVSPASALPQGAAGMYMVMTPSGGPNYTYGTNNTLGPEQIYVLDVDPAGGGLQKVWDDSGTELQP